MYKLTNKRGHSINVNIQAKDNKIKLTYCSGLLNTMLTDTLYVKWWIIRKRRAIKQQLIMLLNNLDKQGYQCS